LDKRKAWREEEQRLVVQAEIDSLRKRVARIKVEFSSGKRY